MTKHIIAISGSTRVESFNTKLLRAFKELAPETLSIEIVDIGDIPLYNEDLEGSNFPVVVQNLKDKIASSDGVIFATPEYNRSIPGVLKNTIDWVSRPYGMSAFSGKLAFVVGATKGHTGTAIAQSHLKQILVSQNMKVIGQPEFYLGGAHEKFNAEGVLTDEITKEHIHKALDVIEKY